MLSVEKGLPVPMHGLLNRLKQVYTRDEILTKCRPVFEKKSCCTGCSARAIAWPAARTRCARRSS